MASELSWSRRLLFTGIVAFFVLLCVESLLQGYYYFSAGDFLFRRAFAPIFAADDVRCYKVKPDLAYTHHTNEFTTTVYTNAQSFRTDERRVPVAYEKPADVFRLLVLGPSFAFGWGSEQEESYAALIAGQLRVPGKRVELINLGTPGQGFGPQLCWLEKGGRRYRPDLVLVTAYGKQVARVPTTCPETLECPIVEDGRLYSVRPTFKRRLIAHVKGYGIVFYSYYLWNAVTPAPSKEQPEAGKELRGAEAEALDRDPAVLVERVNGYIDTVTGLIGGDTQVALLHIPLSYVVHTEDVRRWRHITDANPKQSRAWIESDVATLRNEGVTVIHTTPDLTAAAAEDERMYYWLDIHLTPAGNRVVADAAVPVLQQLIDDRSR